MIYCFVPPPPNKNTLQRTFLACCTHFEAGRDYWILRYATVQLCSTQQQEGLELEKCCKHQAICHDEAALPLCLIVSRTESKAYEDSESVCIQHSWQCMPGDQVHVQHLIIPVKCLHIALTWLVYDCNRGWTCQPWVKLIKSFTCVLF